jgi:carnosine N-methyltransferase
MVVGNGGMIIV